MEAIILAGGLGTRLRSSVPDLPKCMAPINGVPFISFLIDNLILSGVTKFIFSLGYKSNDFLIFLKSKLLEENYTIVIEDTPLGTGGAIKLAMSKCRDKHVIALNGDSIYKANISQLMQFHIEKKSNCTLALKPMQKFDRYGSVDINTNSCIISFREKSLMENGLINGGIYAIEVAPFLNLPFSDKFSFEKDYLEKYIYEKKIYGHVQDAYFIDIGVPEDYQKAHIEFH